MPVLSTLGAAIANVYGFTSGLIKDQYFNLVSLLLPGNGTNGKKNNDFVDSSTANSGTGWPITPNGDVTQGTFSPFSQTGWGAYFDGSNDNVSFASGSQIIPATSDFTIEAWVYPTSVAAGVYNVIYAQTNGGASAGRTSFQTDGSNIAFQCAGTYLTSSSGTVIANRWNYVAATRTGSSVSLYVNGSATTGLTASGSIDSGTSLTAIGVNWSPQYMAGYISNFRVSTTIRSNLTTVPTSPFTNDASTRVLTLQNNRFIDNSSSPFTLTANNGVAITPFSPFAPTSSYSAAAVGGSGYFDGSGDYLAMPTGSFVFGSSDFTIEAWVYNTGTSTGTFFNNQYTSGASTTSIIGAIGSTNGNFDMYIGGSVYSLTGINPTSNQWVHVAIVRTGGTVSVFQNGTRTHTRSDLGTLSINAGGTAVAPQIGSSFLGYMSGNRIIIGSGGYDATASTITVPTAPLTATANTKLLLSYTNAGVVDATAKNVLETEGSAQISTAQSKWGGGSMYFNGSSSYLMGAANQQYEFGSGDFTIECWVNISASAANGGIIGKGPVGSLDNSVWSIEFPASGGTFGFYVFAANSGAFIVSSTTNIKTSTWTHIAICKSGNNTRLFVNGTQEGSTYTTGYTISNGNNLWIGGGFYAPTTRTITGYVDDLRITKYARYTGNFTAPTAPFPLQ